MTTAVILAGGLGTRLRDAVPDLPKPMAPVNGRPFLEYLMAYWKSQGVTKYILSVGYRHNVITSHFGDTFTDIPIEYVIEEEPLGTGGGLILALERAPQDDNMLVLNGDTWFAANLASLQEFSDRNTADWIFSVFRHQDTSRYMGMKVSENGRVLALKHPSNGESCIVNGGVYLLNTGSFRNMYKPGSKLSLEDELLAKAIDSGKRLFAVECEGDFIDIGIPADYYRAPEILEK